MKTVEELRKDVERAQAALDRATNPNSDIIEVIRSRLRSCFRGVIKMRLSAINAKDGASYKLSPSLVGRDSEAVKALRRNVEIAGVHPLEVWPGVCLYLNRGVVHVTVRSSVSPSAQGMREYLIGTTGMRWTCDVYPAVADLNATKARVEATLADLTTLAAGNA